MNCILTIDRRVSSRLPFVVGDGQIRSITKRPRMRFGRWLFLSLAVIALSSPCAAAFSYLGSAPTAWLDDPNTARFTGGSPDASTLAVPFQGGATFSIMAGNLADVSTYDSHVGLTGDITDLAITGFAFDDYVATFNTALNVWASSSGFTNLGFVPDSGADAGALEASGGHIGDIRFAAWEISGASTLAHAFQPATESMFGPGTTIGGDVHFDIDRIWIDDAFDGLGDSDVDLFTVALHEVGHALGLGHSNVGGSVMEAFYGGSRRTLHADDLAGIQSIYGVVYSPLPAGAACVLALPFLLGRGMAHTMRCVPSVDPIV